MEVVGGEVSIGGGASVFSRQVFIGERYFCSHQIFIFYSTKLVLYF